MIFLIFLLYVIFLIFFFTVYSINAYAISPKFPLQIIYDKTGDAQFNTDNNNYLNNSKQKQIESLMNIKTGTISSNGTHLEIEVFFDETLNTLIDNLNNNISDSSSEEFFINILIDSDSDENTGFLGYDYQYFIRNNGSLSPDISNNTQINGESNLTKSLKDHGILTSNELNNIILDSSKPDHILSKLEWIISGFEIVDYQHTQIFLEDIASPKYLESIPKGFKVTLDLSQISFPQNYALLINAGIKSDSFNSNDFFSKIHIPKPDLYVNDQIINIKPGDNSLMIPFNSTKEYDLKAKLDIDEQSIPPNIKFELPQGNTFDILDGIGNLPLNVKLDSKSSLSNLLVPMNITYSVIGESEFVGSAHNNSLTAEHNYFKVIFLNLNIDRKTQLIDFSDIPAQYVGILIGAIFSFFIPSMTRSIKDYKQKRNAHKLLKNIVNENEDDNKDLQKSINRLYKMYNSLRHQFIKGNISKDQYELLKENLHERLKDFFSKKENE
jgi:hypothetical protein